jgi:hypothetical protein
MALSLSGGFLIYAQPKTPLANFAPVTITSVALPWLFLIRI